jgi:hypothetical protein
LWTEKGGLLNPGAPNKWGGKFPPPAVGQKVKVGVNCIGPAVVLEYFEEEGWLGCVVQPEAPPPWYLKQNGGNVPCCVFGPEMKEIEQ